MRSRIENLGDYNEMRQDLQAMGGDLTKLYKEVGDTAVAKAAPKLMAEGGVIVTVLGGLVFVGYKGIRFLKDRNIKVKNESTLKKEFVETIKTEPVMSDNSESMNENLREDK